MSEALWSTDGTFIWVTDDKVLINKTGHLLSFECFIGADEGRRGREARARRIVKAVNCHSELVEALQNLRALAAPHFSDEPQMLALGLADVALAKASYP